MKEDKKWIKPPTLYYIRHDGARVSIEASQCKICEFVTGIARVEWSDKYSIHWTGSGCFCNPRRGMKEAKDWADNVPHP